MSPYRAPVQGSPHVSAERLDAIVAFIKSSYPILVLANVEFVAEASGDGVLLVANRNGHEGQRRWFRATASIKEVDEWCAQLDNLLEAHSATIGLFD